MDRLCSGKGFDGPGYRQEPDWLLPDRATGNSRVIQIVFLPAVTRHQSAEVTAAARGRGCLVKSRSR